MTGLSQPVRRLAALGLLALPLLLAWALLLTPWMEAREALVLRQDRALAVESRALALASRRPALEAEVAGLRESLAGAAEGVPGGSHALAGAGLQRRLREAAARHGGIVQSIETLPEGRAGDGIIGVRARLQTEPGGLRDLLTELETGRMLLQVASLSLTPAAGRGAALRQLEVQIELRGLRGGPEAAP
ncbi:type II secretion system protein GspM [Siccirubricoccus sp. G192]|uniref:type II secretion system protein GspM n=1 Tax=Siccirubricoccus sp. G192 TaxID=2849651 RepID=UPI001C2B9B31|nr:type II secretion system protein GspM [Siccirubricoccus sp. G192]MBV1800139.1 type II secretion system protein M [Siccirubricoccus sp. G192]